MICFDELINQLTDDQIIESLCVPWSDDIGPMDGIALLQKYPKIAKAFGFMGIA